MDIIEQAYRELFPEKEFTYNTRLRYSSAFKPYNANIKLYKNTNTIVVSLSRKWDEVSPEIRRGLIQELLRKLFSKKGEKRRTLAMDLYHIFLKNTHIMAEKDNIDVELQKSFDRVNRKYFSGEIEQTNLIWGQSSTRTLGRYEYGSDTIMISSIFKDAPEEYIDLVMYHEMLHKKHKYDINGTRCTHHTKEFRREEREFKDFDRIDKEISEFVRQKRSRRAGLKRRNGFTEWFNRA